MRSGRNGRSGPARRTFGKAKPLPGQKGYGETESQKVEAQVAAMEARLAMMKVTLMADKQQASGRSNPDGSRWRSGSSNAGSLSGYARDVKDRQNRGRRKKRGEQGLSGPTAGRSKLVKNVSNRSNRKGTERGGAGRFGPKTPRGGRENAEQWTMDEVGQWLTSLSLPQYKSVFKTNAIDGAVLIEMGTEDLDYLGIKALGHRKMILAGLAEIRVDMNAATKSTNEAAVTVSNDPSPTKQPLKPRTHWAVAAAENQRRIEKRGDLPPVQSHGAGTGTGTSDVPLNQGHYDEAAQSALFQQSVMEWRKARAAAKAREAGTTQASENQRLTPGTGTTASSSSASSTTTSAADGGGSLLQGRYDEEEQSRLFQQSVMQWRRDKARAEGKTVDDSQWVNPFGEQPAAVEIEHPPAHPDGGRLLKGEFNESEEHEKFKQAVLSWRRGGGKAGNHAGSPSARKSSCWQCFKVLGGNENQLQLEGKNICSQKCLEMAKAAVETRRARQAAKQQAVDTAAAAAAAAADGPTATTSGTSTQKAASPKAGKDIFQHAYDDGTTDVSVLEETSDGEIRYTGEDLNSLLDSDSWKVDVNY